jgi:hypothetical protein
MMVSLTNPILNCFCRFFIDVRIGFGLRAQMERYDQDKETVRVACRKMETITIKIFAYHV